MQKAFVAIVMFQRTPVSFLLDKLDTTATFENGNIRKETRRPAFLCEKQYSVDTTYSTGLPCALKDSI